MSEERTKALLVTPLPPAETGLATYAMRVIRNTGNLADWTVAYTPGSDPSVLPADVSRLPVEELQSNALPDARIFQIGNSPHCFPIVQALYRLGGTALFHETVLHHMLRYCYLESDKYEDYRRELVFSFGPSAEAVEHNLLNHRLSVHEYDLKLKQYPLIGRILHSCHSAVFLNSYAASMVNNAFPDDRILIIGHPLSELPDIKIPEKPYALCLGVIGTNHPGRNLDLVLEAAELIRNDIPDAGLILIGSGYPTELPEWVKTTGRLEEVEYQGWIRTLDYVIDVRHPTCGETSGSLLEAMRAGIPSIVTASGSFNNMPSDAVIRVLPDNIVQGVVSAVHLLEDRPNLNRCISEKASLYAESTGSELRLSADWKKLLKLACTAPATAGFGKENQSMSPAWQEPPKDFQRDISTLPVSWRFSGNAELTGPKGSSGALVTVWGEGKVGDTEFGEDPSVIFADGSVLHFYGNGWVSNVFWR